MRLIILGLSAGLSCRLSPSLLAVHILGSDISGRLAGIGTPQVLGDGRG
jgi:hypothetical protein